MSSSQVDAYIARASGWQRANLETFRQAIHEVAPDVEEGWKWEVPVFLVRGKLVCAMSVFAKHTKYNFFDGAALSDPDGIFNSGLESKKSRSINLTTGESIKPAQLQGLIAEACAKAA